MVQTKEERKAKQREYNSRPESRTKRREHAQKPETKAKRQTPEYKAKEKEKRDTPEERERAKIKRDEPRLKVLQYYSKRLSKSDIPCCNCCGENSHIDFLQIDHIAGKKEMESIPELIAIGYSSKLKDKNLQLWIINNKFPDGFQILCRNCNSAKGMIKNNYECPMKNKPH